MIGLADLCYFPVRQYPAMVSAGNGSMGYSIASAVAASLEFPERQVVTIAGDGEFLMNGQELATARQYGATPLVVVMDNAEYGTIRTHQERQHPDRVSGTQLVNPDFAAMAVAFGGYGVRVEDESQIPRAVADALAATREGRRPHPPDRGAAHPGVLIRIPNEEENTMNELYDCDADLFLGRPLWFEKTPPRRRARRRPY